MSTSEKANLIDVNVDVKCESNLVHGYMAHGLIHVHTSLVSVGNSTLSTIHCNEIEQQIYAQ